MKLKLHLEQKYTILGSKSKNNANYMMRKPQTLKNKQLKIMRLNKIK